jgi:hypothetical protein
MLILFPYLYKISDHTTILILKFKFRFWALRAYFLIFIHDHTSFGAQILFQGSKGLFLPFDPQNYVFFGPYQITDPNFGAQIPFLGSECFFAFLNPKSVFILASYEILDRWIYHTIILILGFEGQIPFFGFKGLFSHF